LNILSNAVISDAAELEQVSVHWKQQPVLGVDTEFYHTNTFYPITCLYQVSDGERCYLIDPLGIGDLTPFVQLLRNRTTIKVFHSCWSDLRIFHSAIDTMPVNLFDVQMAAAFCGERYQSSYADLVHKYLHLRLPKTETCSDWRKRPLSRSQIRYAQDDVNYLPELYAVFSERLRTLGRLSWYQEEMHSRLQTAIPPGVENYYRTSGKFVGLKGAAVCRFQQLCKWRETTARKRNMPRNWLMTDAQLSEFARQHKPVLKEVKKVPQGIRRRYGAILNDIWQRASRIESEKWPQPVSRFSIHTDQWQELRQLAENRAKELQLPIELLLRKRMLDELMISLRDHDRPTASFDGWRRVALGEKFLYLTKTYVDMKRSFES